MNNIKQIERMNQLELDNGIFGGVSNGSWHDEYKKSAWVYIGVFPPDITEGDVICVMSQFGEIEDINLVREKGTNKSQGFAFVKYEDQRSTILAVDNFNGAKLLGKVLRCDHVTQYKLPKHVREREEKLLEEQPSAEVNIGPGHAYKSKDLENAYDINHGLDIWAPVPQSKSGESNADDRGSSKAGESKKRSQPSEDIDMAEKESKHSKQSKKKKDKEEKKGKKEKKEKKQRHRDHDAVSIKVEANVLPYAFDRDNRHNDSKDGVRRVIDAPKDSVPISSRAPSFAAPISSGQVLAPGAALSWRGTRDPSLRPPPSQHSHPSGPSSSSASHGAAVKKEWGSYGGMDRRR